MTADGTCGERINLEGLTEPLAFMRNGARTRRQGAGLGGGEMRAAGWKVKKGSRTRTRRARTRTRTDSEDEDSEDSEKVDEDSEEEDENSSEEGSRKRV